MNFDRLLDLFVSLYEWFIPWTVIDQYQEAVVLRFGKFVRILGPGFHWVVPFGVENVLSDSVVPRTLNLTAQSLTTLDGVPVVIGAVVTASISNIERALLAVEAIDDALKDSCLGVIGMAVGTHTWVQLHDADFPDTLSKACQKQARRFGIEIMRVQFSDIAKMRAVRLHVDMTNFYPPQG